MKPWFLACRYTRGTGKQGSFTPSGGTSGDSAATRAWGTASCRRCRRRRRARKQLSSGRLFFSWGEKKKKVLCLGSRLPALPVPGRGRGRGRAGAAPSPCGLNPSSGRCSALPAGRCTPGGRGRSRCPRGGDVGGSGRCPRRGWELGRGREAAPGGARGRWGWGRG